MKYILTILLIWNVCQAQTTYDQALTNGNTTTHQAYYNTNNSTGFAQRWSNFGIQPASQNNILLADNSTFNVATATGTYVSTGYISAIQFYNGHTSIENYPSATSGTTFTNSAYSLITDYNGNVTIGGNQTLGTPSTKFTLAALGNGTVHIKTPTTGTATMKVLMFNPSDSSLQILDPGSFSGTGTNIYNSDGALTANRTLSGANKSLQIGTAISQLSFITLNSVNLIQLQGQLQLSGGSGGGAGGSFQWPLASSYFVCSNVTSNSTIILPSTMAEGSFLIVVNEATNAFTWSFASTVKTPNGTIVTTIPQNKSYIILRNNSTNTIIAEY